MSRFSSGMNVSGATVLITGGASGIGAAMARAAAERGADHIILWDLNAEAANAVADRLRPACPVSVVEVDVGNNASVRRAAEATWEVTDHVDILINNAGIVTGKKFLDLTETDIHRTFQINALSLYRVIRQILPSMMEADRGTIVTIASAAGLIGVSRQTDYSASKFAATGFTESLRAELRKSGSNISTLLVQPFYVDTPMFAGVTTKRPALLPILKQDEVADKVLNAIEKGHQSLVLPRFASLVKIAKFLPVPVLNRVADFFGIDETMDEFVGRGPAPSRRRR